MPFPTYEALCNESVPAKVNPEALRLRWTVRAPISEAIFVLDDMNFPNGPRQPAIEQTESPYQSPKLHPISQLSLFEPPVSSITVDVWALELWAQSWHENHIWSDDDDDVNFDQPCSCCGRIAPVDGRELTIKAADEESFLTIADYVAAVHPWLLSLRKELLWALGDTDDAPLPDDTELIVFMWGTPFSVWIEEPKEWLRLQLRITKQLRQN
ncbi:hypothetical protein E4U54_003050 [Claviceps lovelessii]|nr:hypothetical protein E4U54_003050 [Claviceps lovelessii]